VRLNPGHPAFRDSPIDLLVAAAPHAALEAARAVLGGLFALPEDELELLLGTFEAWVRANGSATAAGAELFCHPNTVRYRLRRIESGSGGPGQSEVASWSPRPRLARSPPATPARGLTAGDRGRRARCRGDHQRGLREKHHPHGPRLRPCSDHAPAIGKRALVAGDPAAGLITLMLTGDTLPSRTSRCGRRRRAPVSAAR
jgi:hypothetical protein